MHQEKGGRLSLVKMRKHSKAKANAKKSTKGIESETVSDEWVNDKVNGDVHMPSSLKQPREGFPDGT